ncbi:Sec-independent protein translocase protein TATC chloroplastic [Zea mays]|uniref:Sec-independent protein translocase protein TATC chloroplastic n=1 Tax=Zea mays TaxID=4577 RepID=C0P800_MAIZE|nr:unknown [Zea mays]AQL08352.1 Sec-independent protein translocase protein TATC chloroplastic [Zea mays]
MGSTGALLWHPSPQVHSGGVLFRQSRRIVRQRNLPLLSLADAALEPERRRGQRLRCAAGDGDGGPREAQKESPSGIGAALEDPSPGPPVENGSFRSPSQEEQSALYNFLYPSKDLLPDDKEMSIFDHLEELRERIFISVLAVGAAILGCFAFSKDLVLFLEAPVTVQGVRFLQLSPGEFFFTTLKQCTMHLNKPFLTSWF